MDFRANFFLLWKFTLHKNGEENNNDSGGDKHLPLLKVFLLQEVHQGEGDRAP